MGVFPPTDGPRPLCATDGYNPDWWFSRKESVREQAAKVCGICALQQACREHAVATKETHGVWGGVLLPGRLDTDPPDAAQAPALEHGPTRATRSAAKPAPRPAPPPGPQPEPDPEPQQVPEPVPGPLQVTAPPPVAGEPAAAQATADAPGPVLPHQVSAGTRQAVAQLAATQQAAARRAAAADPALLQTLAPAMAPRLSALADDPLQPDLVDGFSPAAVLPDTTRLWLAMMMQAPEGSLLSVSMVARRVVESGLVLEVGVPIGDPMQEVYLRIPRAVPGGIARGQQSGRDGALDAAELLDRSMDAIAKAAHSMARAWPPPEAASRYTAGRILRAVGDSPRAARMAGHYGTEPEDVLLRTMAVWRQVAQEAPEKELLGRCVFEVDAKRREALVTVPAQPSSLGVVMTRAIPFDALQPRPGGDPLQRAAKILSETLNQFIDNSGPDRVWLALGGDEVTPGMVYHRWRYMVESAPAGSEVASMTCRSHGGVVTLSAPVNSRGAALVQHLDPADPRSLADPTGVMRAAAGELVKARRAAQAALGEPAGRQHLAPREPGPGLQQGAPRHLAEPPRPGDGPKRGRGPAQGPRQAR